MHPRCDPKVWVARGGGQDDRRSAHALRRTCQSSRSQSSVTESKRWTCSVGHRRAHVIEGGPLPLRSPMVPFDCAKFHALWSGWASRDGARVGLPGNSGRNSGEPRHCHGTTIHYHGPIMQFVPTPKSRSRSLGLCLHLHLIFACFSCVSKQVSNRMAYTMATLQAINFGIDAGYAASSAGQKPGCCRVCCL